jgi:hypothetical protein
MADLTQHKIILISFDNSSGLVVDFTIDGANETVLTIPPDQATDVQTVINYIDQYASDFLDGLALIASQTAPNKAIDLTKYVGMDLGPLATVVPVVTQVSVPV